MSLNFALKDITRRWTQSSSYVTAIAIIAAVPVFFIYLISGLGIEIFSDTARLYNFTTFDTFSQYFELVIYLTIAATVIWIITVNHSLVTHKLRDLATMKAVGTVKKKIVGFYIVELLIIDLISMGIGIFVGFMGYLAVFFIYAAQGANPVIFFDYIFIPIMVILVLLLTYFINGWEIRDLYEKDYADISSGDIKSEYSAIGGLRMVPKWIARLGFKAKIAVTNLTRKKRQFYRILIVISLSMSVLITLATGALVVSSSTKGQIEAAQGENVAIFGHEDLITTYELRYQEFSNASLEFNNQEYDFNDSKYLFDESIVSTLQGTGHYGEFGIDWWDKRVFTYNYVLEGTGFQIIGEEGSYQEIGLERESFIPLVGLEFEEYYMDWVVDGDIYSEPQLEPQALVGDTLAHDFFEAATLQSIYLNDLDSGEIEISGVFYDSFCGGNATYLHLDDLRDKLNLGASINLVVIKIDDEGDMNDLIDQLNADLLAELGTQFKALSLIETFEQNIQSINMIREIAIMLVFIIGFTIVLSLLYYQNANFMEKAKDFTVIQAIGGRKKMIRRIVFYEDLMIILVAMSISLGVALNVNVFLLSNAFMPPIYHVFAIWGLVCGALISSVYLGVYFQIKNLMGNKSKFLRVFEK